MAQESREKRRKGRLTRLSSGEREEQQQLELEEKRGGGRHGVPSRDLTPTEASKEEKQLGNLSCCCCWWSVDLEQTPSRLEHQGVKTGRILIPVQAQEERRSTAAACSILPSLHCFRRGAASDCERGKALLVAAPPLVPGSGKWEQRNTKLEEEDEHTP